jgi:protein PhnA
LICPECSQWKEGEASATDEQEVIKDANGNVLADGDRSL